MSRTLPARPARAPFGLLVGTLRARAGRGMSSPSARRRRPAAMLLALAPLIAWPLATHAETHQVKMLNRGAAGAMVYEPDFLKIRPGDTVKFRATTSGHDAASIPEMTPAGATTFKGRINEEIEVTFTEKGFYGIKCLPHYAMGMIMLIQVGDEADPRTLDIPASVPARARKRFEQIIERARKP